MKSLFLLIGLCGALLPAAKLFAGDHGCGCQQANCGHRCPACPKCSNKICTSTVEKTKEEHHCFNVECKEICVPKITLPCWTDAIPFLKCKVKSCGCKCGEKCPHKECCDEPRCGYVKVVKVLKKHEYECDSCGYKWNIESPCNACQSGVCQGGACAQPNADYHEPSTQEGQLPELPPVPPQASYPTRPTMMPSHAYGPTGPALNRAADLRSSR